MHTLKDEVPCGCDASNSPCFNGMTSGMTLFFSLAVCPSLLTLQCTKHTCAHTLASGIQPEPRPSESLARCLVRALACCAPRSCQFRFWGLILKMLNFSLEKAMWKFPSVFQGMNTRAFPHQLKSKYLDL